MKKSVAEKNTGLTKSFPWLIGAGLGLSHLFSSTQCGLTQTGRCNTCGGCLIAIGTLVGWAVMKQTKPDEPFTKS